MQHTAGMYKAEIMKHMNEDASISAQSTKAQVLRSGRHEQNFQLNGYCLHVPCRNIYLDVYCLRRIFLNDLQTGPATKDYNRHLVKAMINTVLVKPVLYSILVRFCDLDADF